MHLPTWLIAIAPVASFVGGYLFRFLGDYLNTRHQRAREKEARDAEHERALRDRRERFELQTLGDLSEALRRHTGCYSAFATWKRNRIRHIEDGTTANAGETSAQPALQRTTDHLRASEARQALQRSTDDLRALIETVLDEELRTTVWDAVRRAGWPSLTMAHTSKELLEQTRSSYPRLAHVRQLVSARIRGIYLAWDIPLDPTPQSTLSSLAANRSAWRCPAHR